MRESKICYMLDWCAIILFLVSTVITTTPLAIESKLIKFIPVLIFFGLCLLFFNHVSIKDNVQSRDKEFFLLLIGIVLGGVNLILIQSRMGAVFTISNFFLLLYLANKVRFDKLQLGAISITCLLLLLYWLFINKEVYGTIYQNPNAASLFIFTHFCVFLCYFVYLLSSFQTPGWIYHIVILSTIFFLTRRIMSFHCRCVLLAIIAWVGTYYILPKKKFTIPLVIGISLLVPVLYVLLWKSGIAQGRYFLGKRLLSGRDFIWDELFKAFIHHPITGTGSDYARMHIHEAHHALLDLLCIHGIPVFVMILYFMYKRISEVITISSGPVRAACLASIYGMFVSGTFENHYIVAPYNVLFLTIFLISHAFAWQQPSLPKSSKS